MKLLNGSELADFIKERQAQEIRRLRQVYHVEPKLAIIVVVNNPATNLSAHLKQRYGADTLVDVEIHCVTPTEVTPLLQTLNQDKTVQGIIVQPALENSLQKNTLTSLISPQKDMDGLSPKAEFDPATPMAIMWLLAGYNIELKGKSVLLIGQGKLVDTVLKRILTASGITVSTIDCEAADFAPTVLTADVIITTTNNPAILHSDMIKRGAIVVDVEAPGEDGSTVCAVASEVYDRKDLTITPPENGVAPLVLCALFENVIRAVSASVNS